MWQYWRCVCKDEVNLLNETLINTSVFPTTMATFPIDLSQYKKWAYEKVVWRADVLNVDLRLSLDPRNSQLSPDERAALLANIQLLRDAIVLFTATGAARGVSGHTGISLSAYLNFCWFIIQGGAYDTVPEVCILLALFESARDFVPIVFDEAGECIQFDLLSSSHRVILAAHLAVGFINLFQGIVLRRSISSPPSKDTFLSSISYITARLTRNCLATPN